MLDTIHINLKHIISDKIKHKNGWKKSKKNCYKVYKKVKLKNGSGIYMAYYIGQCNLELQFSVPKLLTGTNVTAYRFNQSDIVEQIIVSTIEKELGITVSTKDMDICRVDINRDFVFKNEDAAEAVMEFAKKILPLAYEKRKDYPTGFTSLTAKGNGLRVYRKDLDKHIPKKLREQLEPTIRFEFQMNRKSATTLWGRRPNLHQVLTNQVSVELVWNKQLGKYGLDKKIVTRRELHKIAFNHITQFSLRQTLKQINDEPSFDNKKERPKQLAVTRRFKELGICPYSCEVPFTLKIKVCNTIMTIQRKKKRIWNNTANNYRTNKSIVRDTARKTKWYLDSS